MTYGSGKSWYNTPNEATTDNVPKPRPKPVGFTVAGIALTTFEDVHSLAPGTEVITSWGYSTPRQTSTREVLLAYHWPERTDARSPLFPSITRAQYEDSWRRRNAYHMQANAVRTGAPHAPRGTVDRITWDDGYGPETGDAFTNDVNGNWRASAASHLGHAHIPLFDLDIPASLTGSKTPGHYHLEIHALVTWRAYRRILKAMMKAGLIERSWYLMVKRRRWAALRDR